MSVTDSDLQILRAIYRHFAMVAKRPSIEELADAVGTDIAEVEAALERLADVHLLALVPGTRDIWMVHPFAGREAGYAVEAGGLTYQANCGWDALAIPALLGVDATVRCRCPDCLEPLEFGVTDGTVRDDLILHFVVPPTRFWDDIGYT